MDSLSSRWVPCRHLLRRATLAACMSALAACGPGEPAPGEPAPRSLSVATTLAVGASPYDQTIQQIYLAYFGRPADPAGLAWFAGRMTAIGAPHTVAELASSYERDPALRALIDVYSNSAESKELYPGENAIFITAIYRNLFNRDPDDTGLAFWTRALDSGAMSRGGAALFILSGAQNNDHAIVQLKSQAAAGFTAALNTDSLRRGYDGPAANQVARLMLSNVTSPAQLAVYQKRIVQTVENLAGTGHLVMPVTLALPGTPPARLQTAFGSAALPGERITVLKTLPALAIGLDPGGTPVTLSLYIPGETAVTVSPTETALGLVWMASGQGRQLFYPDETRMKTAIAAEPEFPALAANVDAAMRQGLNPLSTPGVATTLAALIKRKVAASRFADGVMSGRARLAEESLTLPHYFYGKGTVGEFVALAESGEGYAVDNLFKSHWSATIVGEGTQQHIDIQPKTLLELSPTGIGDFLRAASTPIAFPDGLATMSVLQDEASINRNLRLGLTSFLGLALGQAAGDGPNAANAKCASGFYMILEAEVRRYGELGTKDQLMSAIYGTLSNLSTFSSIDTLAQCRLGSSVKDFVENGGKWSAALGKAFGMLEAIDTGVGILSVVAVTFDYLRFRNEPPASVTLCAKDGRIIGKSCDTKGPFALHTITRETGADTPAEFRFNCGNEANPQLTCPVTLSCDAFPPPGTRIDYATEIHLDAKAGTASLSVQGETLRGRYRFENGQLEFNADYPVRESQRGYLPDGTLVIYRTEGAIRMSGSYDYRSRRITGTMADSTTSTWNLTAARVQCRSRNDFTAEYAGPKT